MPLVPLAAALALGILLAAWIWDLAGPRCDIPLLAYVHAHPGLAWATALLPLLFLPLAYQRSQRHRPHYLGFAFYLILGGMLYLARPFTPCLPETHIARLADRAEEGKTVVVTGVVTGWPEARGRGMRYRVRVESVRYQGDTRPMWGDILIYASRYPTFQYGDRVRIVGTLSRPPIFEDFDYRRYLARKHIHATLRAQRVVPLDAGHGWWLWRGLYGLRARAAAVIDATLPEPYAALAKGILLGIESDIPRDLYGDFNATGTSHIIVISGFNIAIVAGLFLALLGPLLGSRRAGLVSVLGIGLYVLLVGADAAVVRAGIMGGIFAIGRVVGRRTHALNSLFGSALVMLAFNPLTLWDVGFQLSFLATLGLIVILPSLQNAFQQTLSPFMPTHWKGPLFDLLNEALVVTAAAQITTTPLIVATFGRLSLISLLTNALILPVQPLIMLGAGISTAAGLLWLPVGRVLAQIPLLPLVWTVSVVRVTARWPGAGVAASSWMRPLALAYYAGLALLVVVHYRALLGIPPMPERLPLPRPDVAEKAKRLLYVASGRWKWAILALIPLPLLAAPVQAPAVMYTRLPGGHMVVELPEGPYLLLPSKEPSKHTPRALLDTMSAYRGRPGIWMVTRTDPETLAGLRLLLQCGRPALVLTPALCLPSTLCPETLHAFLATLETYAVPRAALGSGVWWNFGEVKISYVPSGTPGQIAYPVAARAGQIEVIFLAGARPATQVRIAKALPESTIPRVLPLPHPETGVWPDPEALSLLRPTLLLYPEGATYPPASTRALRKFPVQRYDPDDGVRVRVGRDGSIRILSGRQ